jgi:hypothetical protein
MEDRNSRGQDSRLRELCFAVVATAIFFWQLRHPFIRLAWPPANELLGFGLALALPWFADVTLFRLGGRWAKAAAMLSAIPLLLYSGAAVLGMMMTGFAYKDGHDLSFDQFSEAPWKGSSVRLYRTNGGATTDFGVVIRQERKLFPGILLVRNLDSFYHCESLELETTESGVRLQDAKANCRAFSDQYRDYRLKPFLYF